MGDSVVYWPEIVQIHNVRRNIEKEEEIRERAKSICPINFRGKIKLHGSNCGVALRRDDAGFVAQAQSRNKLLFPTDDYMGFASWVQTEVKFFEESFAMLQAAFPDEPQPVIFGEWGGKGINNNVSLCSIGRKIWAVFAVLIPTRGLIVDPDHIRGLLAPAHPSDLFVIPWHASDECGESITLNLMDEETMSPVLANINALIRKIDDNDPWIQEVFGISGPGEGIVWYPTSLLFTDVTITAASFLTVPDFERFAFKTKGEKHAVVKQKAPAQAKAESAQGVKEFVDMFVTPGRCEQGVTKVVPSDAAPAKSHVAAFTKWMVEDVKKESAAELEASKLTWKDVEKAILNKAREWFLAVCDGKIKIGETAAASTSL